MPLCKEKKMDKREGELLSGAAVEVAEGLKGASIREIAAVIKKDWPKPWFGAVPYLDAMFSLDSIDDMYICDTGSSVVAYFLANAQTWKGPVARVVKKELNQRLKDQK
jgi:hypothetical protein